MRNFSETVDLPCHLALGGDPPAILNGNLLLDSLLGAVIHWCGDSRKGEDIPKICGGLRRQGLRPYVIPYGGSNVTGAAGFVEAVREMAVQLGPEAKTLSHVVFASSSGGTHAGLLLGRRKYHLDFQAIGINIDKAGIPAAVRCFLPMPGSLSVDRLPPPLFYKNQI